MSHRWIEGNIPLEAIERIARNGRSRRKTGAQAFFLGQIRADECRGKTVQSIEYSAYRTLADKTFEQLIEEAKKRFDLEAVELLHSEGEVPVGGWSLLVWVASEHRQACFDALRWLVDKVKEEVPIFAKEHFEEGDFQWKKNK